MQNKVRKALLLAGGLAPWAALAVAAPAHSRVQTPPVVNTIPQPGVSEVVGYEALFVRSAYTDEGYVVVGFRPANRSIGNDWLIVDVGATVFDILPRFELNRAAFSLETPDGKVVPLATVSEQRAAKLKETAKLPRDAVGYFPRRAYVTCDLGFFPPLDSLEWTFEAVELNPDRACIGRLYFRIPGGVALGEHWLAVRFPGSVVRVPFTIMTPAEERYLQENFRAVQKQVQEAFPPTR